MLAKIAPASNDFAALARYLVHGKPGTTPHPDRVAWAFTTNLPTEDPELAAKLMQATAERSARTRNAAYHLMIAWEETEHPTPEVMQAIARQTLELAGLAEHQALVMGHGDKPHRHLHILLNRVHPGTGKAWKTSHDFQRFDAIMRQLAGAHGFRYVPAHAFNPEETAHLPKQPTSRAAYAARRGANTARLQWSRNDAAALGERLSESIDRASTSDDIADALASHGLTFEAKGKGYVAGNAQGYVKLSALSLSATAKEALRRLPRRPASHAPDPRTLAEASPHRVFSVDGIDILRAFVTLGLAGKADLMEALDDVHTRRLARLQRHPLLARLLHKLAATTAHTRPPTRPKAPRPRNRSSPARSR